MNLPSFIAKRYLISKSGNNAINIITIIAAMGTIVATAALFVVLSGFSGLKHYSLNFFKAADPDIKITTTKGKTFLFSDTIQNILNQEKAILAHTKVLEERAFFNYRHKEHIAFIKGVDENYLEVVKMDTVVIGGKWLDPDFPYGVVVGNAIANRLSLGIDYLEPLKIYVPKPGNNLDLNPTALVNSIETRSIGVFAILEEIDSKYVFTYLPIAQDLLNYSLDRISALSLRLEKGTNTKKIAKNLQKKLGNTYKVQTRAQLNAVFYKMLNTENLILYFIFTLVLIIALFNIIGAIIMMILDKKNNLKTLYNLGASSRDLKRIFVYQGFLLSIFGLIVGLIIGIVLVLLQKHYQLLMISSVLAYPVRLTFQNIALVVFTMLVLSYLAAQLASSRINTKMLEN